MRTSYDERRTSTDLPSSINPSTARQQFQRMNFRNMKHSTVLAACVLLFLERWMATEVAAGDYKRHHGNIRKLDPLKVLKTGVKKSVKTTSVPVVKTSAPVNPKPIGVKKSIKSKVACSKSKKILKKSPKGSKYDACVVSSL